MRLLLRQHSEELGRERSLNSPTEQGLAFETWWQVIQTVGMGKETRNTNSKKKKRLYQPSGVQTTGTISSKSLQ